MTRVHSVPAEWLPVSIAPSDVDLEVCVMDYDGIVHARSLCSACSMIFLWLVSRNLRFLLCVSPALVRSGGFC